MAKIISFKKACELSKKFRKEGKKVVFTSGCFDILHLGHIRFFKSLRKWSGQKAIIICGVDMDRYLKTVKGQTRPIFSQNNRAEILSSIIELDFVAILDDRSFISRYKDMSATYVAFGNSEPKTLELIKKQVLQTDSIYKHIGQKIDYVSTTNLAKIILDNFSS